MSKSSPIAALRQKFPWPDESPPVAPVDWSIDAGGRQLIIRLIKERNISLILEIGVFLGGSTRTWLKACPDLQVIAVDPWPGSFEADFAIEKKRPELADQLRGPDGSFHTFLSSMWRYRDRVVPVRGWAPQILYDIHATGVNPDLIYINADKNGREINVCHQLFPDAILTGDDWWWGKEQWSRPDDGYPIRKPVKEFCAQHDRYLRTSAHTWVIDTQPPGFSYQLSRPMYHLKSARRRLRGLVRHAIRNKNYSDKHEVA